MKAFVISADQISSVIAALIVDELAARFGRHVDSMTGAGWSSGTVFGGDGVGIGIDEKAACGARVLRFFGGVEGLLEGETIGEWAVIVARELAEQLTEFSFAAAGYVDREFPHPADAIYADAAACANLLYGRRRVLSLVAPHGLMGFVLTVLAPNLLQIPAVDGRTLAPDQLREMLAFGDALVATPSLWRYMLKGGVTAPDNAMAVYFGEPMAPDLSAEMRKAGFSAQRELYGSTETGLIGWRDSTSDPFALFDQWKREGEELIHFAPSGGTRALTPMDLLRWQGERRFRLAGRRDGAAQVGAINVFPSRIAAQIAEHPAVNSCTVEVSAHPDGGSRLVAFIRLEGGGGPTESLARSIDSWCRNKLRPQERPRVYNFEA